MAVMRMCVQPPTSNCMAIQDSLKLGTHMTLMNATLLVNDTFVIIRYMILSYPEGKKVQVTKQPKDVISL